MTDAFMGTPLEGIEPDWEVVRCIVGKDKADQARLQWQREHEHRPEHPLSVENRLHLLESCVIELGEEVDDLKRQLGISL